MESGSPPGRETSLNAIHESSQSENCVVRCSIPAGAEFCEALSSILRIPQDELLLWATEDACPLVSLFGSANVGRARHQRPKERYVNFP